jgi:hypothetical protein
MATIDDDAIANLSSEQKSRLIRKLLVNEDQIVAELAQDLNTMKVTEDFKVNDWTNFIVNAEVKDVWFNVKTSKYYYYNSSRVPTNIGKSKIQKSQLKLYKDTRAANKVASNTKA